MTRMSKTNRTYFRVFMIEENKLIYIKDKDFEVTLNGSKYLFWTFISLTKI